MLGTKKANKVYWSINSNRPPLSNGLAGANIQQQIGYRSFIHKSRPSIATTTFGDWEAWFRFSLNDVKKTVISAAINASGIIVLHALDRALLRLIKPARILTRIYGHFRQHPVLNAQMIETSYPLLNKGLNMICDLGIVQEVTGGQRNPHYVYTEYISLLTRDTD